MVEISRSRSILLLISAGILNVIWGLLLSLLPPFYPTEAEKKGATSSQYGFVFGIANLAAFLGAPLFGHFGTRIGPKLLCNVGAFVQAISAVAFGFMDYVENTSAFLGLCYFLRFMCGLGDAAAWGALISILMKIYPNQVTTIAAWTEMLVGFGFMIGPLLGSALYSAGGFTVPFFAVGSFATAMSIVLCLVIPKISSNSNEESDSGKPSATFKDLVMNPTIFMPFVDNFLCFCGQATFESFLEPHMKEIAGGSQYDVSITFLVMGASYMVSSVLAGYVCGKVKVQAIVSLIGNVLMALAFLLVGPVPFLSVLPTSIPLMQGSAAILGIGYALIMVSSFGRSQSAAIRKGYEDDMGTYIFISSMWSSSFYLGSFAGPTFSGILVDNFGFPWTTMFYFFIFCVMIAFDSLEFSYLFNLIRKKAKSGYSPLE